MSDNKKIRGPQDKNFINVNEGYEVEYWTRELGISEQQLQDAVQQVGTSVKAVRKLIGQGD